MGAAPPPSAVPPSCVRSSRISDSILSSSTVSWERQRGWLLACADKELGGATSGGVLGAGAAVWLKGLRLLPSREVGAASGPDAATSLPAGCAGGAPAAGPAASPPLLVSAVRAVPMDVPKPLGISAALFIAACNPTAAVLAAASGRASAAPPLGAAAAVELQGAYPYLHLRTVGCVVSW